MELIKINKNFTKIISTITIAISLFGYVQAQTKTGLISGAVKTNDGKPAAYVNVAIKNTNKSTQTDENGNYSFKNLEEGNTA